MSGDACYACAERTDDKGLCRNPACVQGREDGAATRRVNMSERDLSTLIRLTRRFRESFAFVIPGRDGRPDRDRVARAADEMLTVARNVRASGESYGHPRFSVQRTGRSS